MDVKGEEVLSSNDWFIKGKKLFLDKKFDEAEICFNKSYEIDPNNYEVCFELFLNSIRKDDYNEVLKYFICLENIENDKNNIYKNDRNFYLYLLSMIIKLKEEYRIRAKKITFKDIKINSKGDNKVYLVQNEIRALALNQNFKEAYIKLYINRTKIGRSDVANFVVRNLLKKAIESQNIHREKLSKLIETKSYRTIIDYLRDVEHEHSLCVSDMLVLRLASDALNIISYGTPPFVEISKTDNYYEAIKRKNYKLALKILNTSETDISDDLEGLTLVKQILRDIINIIDNFEKEKNQPSRDYIINNLDSIVKLISEGKSISEACQEFNIDKEGIDFINLIFAKECYYNGDYSLGDMFLKNVEKSKDKSKFIADYLDEIRKKRKFYKNRVEGHKPLVLVPRIKK